MNRAQRVVDCLLNEIAFNDQPRHSDDDQGLRLAKEIAGYENPSLIGNEPKLAAYILGFDAAKWQDMAAAWSEEEIGAVQAWAQSLSGISTDFDQEDEWWNLAKLNGIDQDTMRSTAQSFGVPTPKEAVNKAYAEAGKTFPKRGSWSGELVWLFLALFDAGLVDEEGNSTQMPRR